VAAARASDRGFPGASVCASGPGTAGPTWRRAGDIVRGSAGCTDSFHLTFFQLDFLKKIQVGVLQTLNTKVVKQVALFNNGKGSVGFYSLV
jgi:hypothetical protein